MAAASAQAQPSAVLGALSRELQREFTVLREKADPPPYFLSYELADQESWTITGALGALTSDSGDHKRYLDVAVRVGTPALDSYHALGNDRAQFTAASWVAIDDHPDSLKMRLWSETDRVYRAAAERLTRIQTSTQVKVAREDGSNDFSAEAPSVFQQTPPAFRFDRQAWAARVRKLSARFREHPRVLASYVTVECRAETRWFVNTEGSRIQHGRGFARIGVFASSRAADGATITLGENFDALDETGLPGDAVVLAAIDRTAQDVAGLLDAPEAEPFAGPAIFSGRAAGLFFHEIFGHRMEGERQKDESEGQTFARSVGTKILPDFLSVFFDPTRRRLEGVDLNGWYEYDNEGIKAQPVAVVENGVLKAFLMSRSPIRGFAHSNGHGRRAAGMEPYSRQSNLIVQSSRAVPEARLREMLLEEVKRQKKPYGLYFRDVTNGYTVTGRGALQAFKVVPVIVYRVYPDGRPDELVRGAEIVGTPLAGLGKIAATSDKVEVFNGYCGAYSGWVPVSASSPAILIAEIEIEKKEKTNDRPPLLPPPYTSWPVAAGGAK